MKRDLSTAFLFCLTFMLAACSILYELMIAHAISLLSANTVVRYSITIGLYLGAMGIGALACNKVFAGRDSWESLFQTELLLSLTGALAVALVHFGHMFYGFMYLADNPFFGVMGFFSLSFLAVVAVGFLTGFELPLLIAIGMKLSPGKRISNRLLSADYMGSLIAALAFPLLLLPNFELVSLNIAVALVNLLCALVILLFFLRTKVHSLKKTLSVSVLALALIVSLLMSAHIEQYFLQKYYSYRESFRDIFALFSPSEAAVVQRFTSPYQKIDIVKYKLEKDPFTPILVDAYSTKYQKDPAYPRDYYLFLNGDYQFSSDVEELYHEYFAHIPIIVQGEVPKKVLVLGGGDGLLNKELLKHPEIEKIIHVDLDQTMLDVARTHPIMRYMNKGSLDDSRVTLITEDAYHYIKNTDQRFDAIYIDLPDPYDYNLAKLYSREFYHFVRKALRPGGFAVIDAPGSGIFIPHDEEGAQYIDPNNNWLVYYHTLKASGFDGVLPFVTNLELDNQRARKLLEKERIVVTLPSGRTRAISKELKRSFIEQIIHTYVHDMQKGFIFLKEEPVLDKPLYREMNVSLDILNRERFDLAFALPHEFSEEIRPEKVNSIMRPKFPDFPFWFVLLPY